jgi:RNA polymerase sigma-B factor
VVGTDDLLLRCKTHGDQAARDELIRRYLPLARKLARRYAGAREPLDDLIQVASVGLVKAVDRFDPQRGIAFPAFAVPTILGELKRYFRDLGWSVHVPRGTQEMALQIGQATERLTSGSGRAPSVSELAQYLEWSLEDVVDALEAASAHHAVSLDAPRESGHDEPASTLGRALGGEDPGYAVVDTRLTLAAAVRLLPARDRRILCLRFVADLTQTQIAERIGISQMQVSRILRRALARLGELAVDGAPGPVR